MTTQQTARDQLNTAVRALEKLSRPAAVAILARYGALRTPELKTEDIPAVHAEFVEALKKFNDVP